jgi:Phosphotransferase enzyme family
MTTDILAALQAVDLAVLTNIVRQDQCNPGFELLDWTVQPLSHEKIIETTGGIYRVHGNGRVGSTKQPWSVVVKIINQSQGSEGQRPHDWCYWQREMHAFQSGMLAALPSAIRAPRCYAVMEQEHSGWIWLEHLTESTGRRWTLADFQRAAYQMGSFAGAYLTGTPLPDYPWLGDPFFRSLFADGGWWATHMALTGPESLWQSLIIQQAFSPALCARVQAVWAEKDRFFTMIDRLPQIFCHHDLHRRNLMWTTTADGDDELVVLDWAFCGHGPVGSDLGELVATSSHFFDSDPSQVAALEATVFASYLEGLRTTGWSGDERLVRLGYVSCAALWMGATLPGWAAIMLDPAAGGNVQAMYGHPAEEVLAGWVTLTEFLMDRADEARILMAQLAV